MWDLDRWQEIFESLTKHKLRTALTALGVFWGIFMLVVLMGAGNGFENGVKSQFGDMATNSMFVWTQPTTKPYMGLDIGRRPKFLYSDLLGLKDRYENKIDRLAGRLNMGNIEIIKNNKVNKYEVSGDMVDVFNIMPIELLCGRLLNQKDIDEKRKIIVLGKEVAQFYFNQPTSAIGQYLKINGIEFQIVGVAASSAKGRDKEEDEKVIYMPLSTVQQILNLKDQVHYAILTAREGVVMSEIQDDIKAFLRRKNKIHPDDATAINSFNLEEIFKQVQGLFIGMKVLIWIVGFGSLLAGIIGVGNIMLITVKERTREIGIRKALGAKPNTIVAMILQESIFLTFVSGYSGLLAGAFAVYLMKIASGDGSEFFLNPMVTFSISIQAIFVLVIAGALTGLVPARRAARINPIEALKEE